MIIYIAFFIILLGGSIYQQHNKSANIKWLICCVFVLFVLHDGLRCNMGTDWGAYYQGFIDACQFEYNDENEVLYTLLQKIVCLFTNNYSVFLVAHAFCIYLFYFYWIRKYVPNGIFIALLIFYTSLIGYLGMNRQHIALAMCVTSTIFLLNHDYRKFIILCALAFGFHRSAIIFPFVAIALNRKIKWQYWVLILGIVIGAKIINIGQDIFVFVTGALDETAQDKSEYYLAYEGSRSFIGTLLGLSKKILILVLLYFNRHRLPFNNPYLAFAFNMYLVGVLMIILFDGSLPFLLGRFTVYYTIFECILWAYLLASIKPSRRLLVICCVLGYAMITFYRSIDLYPDLFIPYRSIITETPIVFYK